MQSSILLIRRFIINSNELERLIKYYNEGNLSHAYLISTNNTKKCMEVLLKVVKNIFCNEKYIDNCKKCSLCHLIDINNLPSLKIIESEGNFIKKDQILELKSLFSKNSQYTNENIYIIKNCEKMNKESANTMLKFLEEPDGNIIGFFITNHQDNVLSTIQSRCQHIDVIFDNEIYENYNIEKTKYNELKALINEYIYKIEVERNELIIYNKTYLTDFTKEDIKLFFRILLSIYKSELNRRFEIKANENYYEFLKKYKIYNITKKINLIIEVLKEINYNINVDLLLDRFVIEMDGINNEAL